MVRKNMFADLIDNPNSLDMSNNMFADLLPKYEQSQVQSSPQPTQQTEPSLWDKIKALDIKGLTGGNLPGHQGFFDPLNDGGGKFLPGDLDNTAVGKFLTRANWGNNPANDNKPKPESSLPLLADLFGGVQQFSMGGKGGVAGALGQDVFNMSANVGKDIPGILKAGKSLPSLKNALGVTASEVGNMLPFQANTLGKSVLGMGAGGAGLTAADAYVNNKDLTPQELLMSAGQNALLGGAFHLGGKGIELGGNKLSDFRTDRNLGQPIQPINEAVSNQFRTPTLRDATQQQYNNIFKDTPNLMEPVKLKPLQRGIDDAVGVLPASTEQSIAQKKLDAQSAFGGPRKVNKSSFATGEQRALQELQNGIAEAQNYVRHTDVLAPYPPGTTVEQAYADVFKNTGVDLPKLLSNWENTQSVRGPLSQAERLMGRKAGVIPPLKQREGFPIEQTTAEQPFQQRTLPEKPAPLQWTNREGIMPTQKPFQSIDRLTGNRLQPEFMQSSAPKTEMPTLENFGIDPLGQARGQAMIEPRIPMRLQAFNDAIPALPNTASHIVSTTDRQPLTLDNIKGNYDVLKTNAYIKTTDNLHRLNQLDQYVEKTTGEKLSPSDKTYMLALNSRGTGSTASHILEENLVNPEGNVIGESLKTITKQLKNSKVAKEFDNYLVNKHAITRMNLGEKVFPDEMEMTPGMSEAIVKRIESAHPEFKELSNKLYEFQNKLSKAWLVDTGIVSPEAYGSWVIDNPHYVPNNRLFSELEQPGFSGATKRGFAGQSNPVKARTGSQRQIISPLESIMEHVDQYVKVAKRNEVMQTLIRNIEKSPDDFKGWAEIIPDDKQLKSGLVGDINETLARDGIDGVVEQFNKQFDDIFSAKKQRLDLGNIVTGLVDGEKVHVRVNDPLLLDALTNLKPQAQQVVIAALGQVTRVMKNLTTGINPVFGLARNIWRDIPTAFINSKSTNNPLAFGKDLLGSIVDIIGNKDIYKSYKALGGGHASSSVSASRNTLAESKARLLPGYALKHPFKTALGGLERLNNTVETAPRLAEFKRVSKAGDYDSKVKGLYEANDITTNFSKFGNVVKEADSVFPYLNAAWQGIDKLARTFKDNPVQAPLKALTAVTFPTIVLYQLNHNNPAYQQLSDYIKDNNFLFPKGDGTFIKIPKPREIGVVFGSSVERVMRGWQDEDPDSFNRFMETVKTNFMPPITRSILAPLSDVRSNKNFIDAPIVSGSVSRLSPALQFDEKTSEPAKALGKVFNKSPQQIDYLARSYLGGVAQLGLPALTKNASVGGTLKKQVTADPTFSNDIIGDFYNTKDKIDTSASDATATGDKNLELGRQYKTMFSHVNTQLGDIRKEIDKVQAGTASSEDKEVRIRALQIKMINLARSANSKFKLK